MRVNSIELAVNLPDSQNTDNGVQKMYALNQRDEAGDSGEDSPTKSLKCLAAEYSAQQKNSQCEEAIKEFPVHKLSSESESNDEEESSAIDNSPKEPTLCIVKESTIIDYLDVPPPSVAFIKEVRNTNEEDAEEVVEVKASSHSKDSESPDTPQVAGQDLPEYLDMPPPSVLIVNEIRKSTETEGNLKTNATAYLDLPPPSVSIVDEVIIQEVPQMETIDMETISNIGLSPTRRTITTLSPGRRPVQGDEKSKKELPHPETIALEAQSPIGLSPPNRTTITLSASGVPARVGQLMDQIA